MRLRWRPFLLRPDIPEDGIALSALIPPDYLKAAEARLEQAIAKTSLPPLNRPALVPNTLLAHEAAHFAEENGVGNEFHQACLRANFAEARNIGDPEVLADIGASVGLDRQALLQALEAGTYRKAVADDLAAARAAGVSAVPTFVFGGRVGFSGAQPYDVFLQALERVKAEG